MKQNRIHQTPADQDPQSFIPRCVIEYYERMDFVENVCRGYNNDHFESGNISQPTMYLNDGPGPAPAAFNMFDDEMVPFYAMPNLGREISRTVGSRYQRPRSSVIPKATAVGPPAFSASNLGRGSPRSFVAPFQNKPIGAADLGLHHTPQATIRVAFSDRNSWDARIRAGASPPS